MYYFIVNPNSRSGKGALIWKKLHQILIERNISYQVYFTKCRGHAIDLSLEISKKANKNNRMTIVAVGGDGTIQEVLTGLKNISYIHFGYIPTGSGNDFCRSMKLPGKPEAALETILSSKKTRTMDIAEIMHNGHVSRFSVSCGLGFDAAVCHEVAVSPVKKILNHIGLGKLAYLLIGVKQILFLPPASLSVSTDLGGTKSYDKVYLTAVMNQKYEGGGFKFCPGADSRDGFLDVIIIEGLGRLKLVFCLFLSIFGLHTHFRSVHLLQCKNLTITSKKPLALHMDGEPSGFQKELTVSVTNKSLQVIIP